MPRRDIDSFISSFAVGCHLAIDSFYCNLFFDSDAARQRAIQTLGFFYRIRSGEYPNPDLCFYVGCNTGGLAELVQQPDAPNEIVLLSYPSDGEHGTVWTEGAWEIIYSSVKETWRAVHKQKKIVVIVGSELAIVESALLRGLRLVVDALLVRHDWLRLHAAAVVENDHATLIVGEQGAGKTTAMFELIINHAARILAFDKVALRVTHNHVVCLGLPASLGLGIGTAKRYGVFTDQFSPSLRSISPADAWYVKHEQKARIPPAIVAQHFSSANEAPYRLRTIIFPMLTGNRGSELVPLSQEDGVERLRDHIIAGSLSQFEFDWIRFNEQFVFTKNQHQDTYRRLRSNRTVEYLVWHLGKATDF